MLRLVQYGRERERDSPWCFLLFSPGNSSHQEALPGQVPSCSGGGSSHNTLQKLSSLQTCHSVRQSVCEVVKVKVLCCATTPTTIWVYSQESIGRLTWTDMSQWIVFHCCPSSSISYAAYVYHRLFLILGIKAIYFAFVKKIPSILVSFVSHYRNVSLYSIKDITTRGIHRS